MNSLICPISTQTLDKRASRIGAALTAVLLVGYSLTGFWPVLLFVVADYVVRVLTPYRAPVARLGGWIARSAGLDPAPMNAGPKIFAWRLGFLMAVVSLLMLPVSATASVIVAALLAGFNVLDGVFNLCVGCVIYTHVVLPFNTRTSAPEPASSSFAGSVASATTGTARSRHGSVIQATPGSIDNPATGTTQP